MVAWMLVPDFVLRKIYQRGSLRETGDGRFAFTLQNPLGEATLTGPPRIVVNGIAYRPEQVRAQGIELAQISPERPLVFRKGMSVPVELPGRLLRGGNRIHITALTREYGEVEVYVEDSGASFCELPGAPPEAAA
jgi:hypothetical protein